MSKASVLTVDDDQDLQTVMEDYLVSDGYNVIKAETFAEGLEKSSLPNIDVILLDLGLPDGEGMTLIPQIKSATNAGVIVVSGKDDTTEKIVCLEMGADDYLTKPFEMRELTARIKAVLRRRTEAVSATAMGNAASVGAAEAHPDKFEFLGFILDRSQYQLFDEQGNSMGLTTGEFQLLDALVSAANRVLTREHLFELTREGKFDVYDRAIDIQIARLRKKLGDTEKPAQIIKTIRGVGYMFIMPN